MHNDTLDGLINKPSEWEYLKLKAWIFSSYICSIKEHCTVSVFSDVVEIGQLNPLSMQDNEGQTPLHYAVVCDRQAIAEYLVKHNADVHVKDNEGASPSGLCEKSWPCMQAVNTVV